MRREAAKKQLLVFARCYSYLFHLISRILCLSVGYLTTWLLINLQSEI